MFIIRHNYKNMSPSELEAFSALVTSRLSDNPIFAPIKEATLLTLNPAHKAFSAAMLEYAKYKGTDRSDQRSACQETLIKELFLTAGIVQAFAKDNASIIETAGYVLRKTEREKTNKLEKTPLTAPTNFNVVDVKGKPGVIAADWDKIKSAIIYILEYRIHPDSPWLSEATSDRKLELSGFPPKTIIECRIRSQSSNGEKSEYSAIVAVLVS